MYIHKFVYIRIYKYLSVRSKLSHIRWSVQTVVADWLEDGLTKREGLSIACIPAIALIT